jgi:single-strand DNA-binding protein
LKYTPNGIAVASFTLAVNRNFKNAQGEQEADFINIVVWRKPAENAANYLKKGSLCGIDGKIQSRSYDNNEGKRVYVTEVVAESVQFLEPRGDSTSGSNNQTANNNQRNNQNSNTGQRQQNNGNYTRVDEDPFSGNGSPIDISDDDLPF